VVGMSEGILRAISIVPLIAAALASQQTDIQFLGQDAIPSHSIRVLLDTAERSMNAQFIHDRGHGSTTISCELTPATQSLSSQTKS